MGMYSVTKDSFEGWDEELAKKASMAIHSTWQYIGSDFMDVIGNRNVKRSEVLELVLDADRMETCGLPKFKPTQQDRDEHLKVCQYTIWMYWHKPTLWKRFLKEYLPNKTW